MALESRVNLATRKRYAEIEASKAELDEMRRNLAKEHEDVAMRTGKLEQRRKALAIKSAAEVEAIARKVSTKIAFWCDIP